MLCRPGGFGFASVLFIDCRFRHEFEGGHIEGAVNAATPAAANRWGRLCSVQIMLCFTEAGL